jgi:hypothetical protein
LSGQLSKERFEKRLRIAVRSDGKSFVLLDGQPLPELAKNSVAELVLAPECIKDETIRANFSRQKSTQFLKAGTFVLVGVSPTMIENLSAKGLIPAHDLPIMSAYLFVEVKLEADLWLLVRGDQEARLSTSPCAIPSLNKEAKSLNHAFTLISEAYEIKRRSHSGNVFERAYAQDESGNWKSLDEFRVLAIQKVAFEATDQPATPTR